MYGKTKRVQKSNVELINQLTVLDIVTVMNIIVDVRNR